MILGPVQWVKDPVLPQLWHKLQLQLRLDPWPRNFHAQQVQSKKKKEEKNCDIAEGKACVGDPLSTCSRRIPGDPGFG